MPPSHGPAADPENILEETKKRLKHHTTVLREYAKWSLIREHQFTQAGESHYQQMLKEFFSLGTEVRLSDRDMVLMLLGGLFHNKRPLAD